MPQSWNAGGAEKPAGGASMPPFGMYAIMAPGIAAPRAPAHANPIAKRSHTSQNDVSATRDGRNDCMAKQRRLTILLL
jgi:hypothetical protein